MKERLTKVLNVDKKSGKTIALELLLALKHHKNPLTDCHSQGYDNCLNINEKIKGVKTCIP
jgi:hypothetical protein